MDANLSISSNSALGGAASQAAPGAAPSGAELRGADFADLLRGLRDEPGRQDLAAAGLAEAGLQAVALSPQLELITAATPVPDADSLMAFARTQGLDDGTLAMLFGGTAMGLNVPAAGQAGASLLTGAAVPAAWALGATPGAGLPMVTPGASLLGPVPGTSPLLASASEASAAGLTVSAGAAALVAQAGAVGLSAMSWQVSQQAAGTQATTAPLAAEAGAPDTLAEALRLQLQMPREAIAALTKRLAGLAGSGQAVAWGQLQAQAMTDGPEVLDMREFFSDPSAADEPALTPDAGDAPTAGTLPALEGGRRAAASLALPTDSAAPASQAGVRAEHYQQLADRLGQALAQRLQAQIERGEWKLQMRMNPASLGRIDMELDMRAGGLDAVFRSDNAVTRELIAQGLPKLRDSLAQSGTTVAHVWVNGDSAGQPGGNPTPQSATPPKASRDSGDSDKAGATEAPALTVSSAKRASDSDWDVLA